MLAIDPEKQTTGFVAGPAGVIRAVCPARFVEKNTIFQWIGEVLFRNPNPIVLGNVPFLENVKTGKDVGKIDNIIVNGDSTPMQWAALEIQAVYLSGCNQEAALQHIAAHPEENYPITNEMGRPDYRSSSVKRLMPQLQIKVPMVSRWGKRMTVVVDEGFFDSLGHMNFEPDLSRADIAWFVVGYDEIDNGITLSRREVKYTTLVESVAGLTSGRAISLEEFEEKIRTKMRKRAVGLTLPNPDSAQ